jgi:tRNA pseudouridine-54 N-methylase
MKATNPYQMTRIHVLPGNSGHFDFLAACEMRRAYQVHVGADMKATNPCQMTRIHLLPGNSGHFDLLAACEMRHESHAK